MKTAVEAVIRFAIITLFVVGQMSSAAAQDVANFYRGKTVRLLIPTGPGGDRSLYALAFATYYGRHIPGNPTVTPVFMPGAGGSMALNNLYSVAAPDGLTIATPLTSVLNAQVTGEISVNYDTRKFTWIGRISDATRVHVVMSSANVTSLDDLRRTEVAIGAVGTASETYSNAAFMNYVFGTKYKIISGYGAAAKMLMAMEAGETQGAFSTWNDIRTHHMDKVNSGKMRILMQIALTKHRELPNVPLLLDLAQTEEDRQLVALMSSSSQMGQAYAGPPGLPLEIVQALRRAFDATMADPEYVEKLKAANTEFNPMTGEDLEAMVQKVMSAPANVIERYKAAVAPPQK